ncbi:nuclear transport factor 2 family protein, partial [Acidocella aquatica]|uniref:nuclear transport factor 2 family protein n=1 Tax=Acidocella aquatica TaxID=1922313 RepID=UPI0024E148E3
GHFLPPNHPFIANINKRRYKSQEICLLKARQDRTAETNDRALYESLHAPDHPPYNGDYPAWTTAVEMIANVSKIMKNFTTLHHSHSPEITFQSRENAHGIWAMKGLSVWRQDGIEHEFLAFCHYFETYEKRTGKWFFTSRKLKYFYTKSSPGAIFPPRIDNTAAAEKLGGP